MKIDMKIVHLCKARYDETKLSSLVASAVCTRSQLVGDSFVVSSV